MRHEFEYDPTKPGSADLPRPVALPASRCTMDTDTFNQLLAEKSETFRRNTRELEKAYVKHQHVLVRFDRLIRSLDRLADTPELRVLVTALRLQRAEAERLLFTAGHELRRDSMTMRINLDL